MGSSKPLDLSLLLDVDRRFTDALGADRVKLLQQTIERVLANEGIAGPVALGLRITGDEEIQDLNAQFRGKDAPTDVLSFPLEEPAGGQHRFVTPPGWPRELGDVVISFPRAAAQAQDYGHSLEREIAYLAAHGTLHLLGYDHEDDAGRRVMREKEEAALPDLPR